MKEVQLAKEVPPRSSGPGVALLKQQRDCKTFQLAEALLLSPSSLAISVVSGWQLGRGKVGCCYLPPDFHE